LNLDREHAKKMWKKKEEEEDEGIAYL